jgi:hypothetical protein
MINTTALPILVDKNLSPQKLDTLIRQAITDTLQHEALSLESTNGFPKYDRHGVPTFAFFFESEPKSETLFDLNWLQRVFLFTQEQKNPKFDPTHLGLDNILTCNIGRYNHYIKSIKSKGPSYLINSKKALKAVLLNLWANNLLLLPMNTLLRASDVLDREYLNKKEVLLPIVTHSKSAIRNRGLKVLFATDWSTIEDVDLSEYSILHQTTLKHSSSELEVKGIARWPFIPLLEALVDHYASRAKGIESKLESYKHWTRGKYYDKHSFEYFDQHLVDIRSKQKQKYNERKAAAHKKMMLNKHLSSQTIPDDTLNDSDETYLTLLFREIAKKNTHEVAIEYFITLARNKGFPRLKENPNDFPVYYPGREHIQISKLGETWEIVFDSFIQSLIYDDGIEKLDGIKSALNLVRDYLYLYLPWWIELHPKAGLQYPSNPLDFKRAYFWRRTRKSSNLPLTLYELVAKRRQGGGVGTVVSTVNKLFEYIRIAKDEFVEFRDKEPFNPVSIELDYPKLKRRHKSNKIPFSKRHMPYLLRYVYALEKFGVFLQELAIETPTSPPLPNSRGIQKPFITPSDFEYSMSIEFNGFTFPITTCPPIFRVSKRCIATGKTVTKVNIAHLSALRICIIMLETGLRQQQVKWLDRETWDSLNQKNAQSTPLLFVNTDKKKDRPWLTPIAHTAHQILKREEQFQLSIREPQMSVSYTYSYRKKSRFGEVLPLFRGTGSSGKVINSKAVDDVWKLLMIGFQTFYNQTVLNEINSEYEGKVSFFEILPKTYGNSKATLLTTANGEVSVDEDIVMESVRVGMPKPQHVPELEWPEKITYCLLSTYSIHTPHSARSTFASRRNAILELTDIQKLIGHENAIVTLYYTVEDEDETFERAESARNEIFNYIPEQKRVHLHPDSADSSTRRAITDNPDQAIRSYGFQIFSLLNEDPEPEHDGLALLKTTPANRLEFQPSHICVTGGHCPNDIMDVIYQPRRCGLCPIAVKGIDHLTGIAAKINQLTEQVFHANSLLAKRQQKLKEKLINEGQIRQLEEQRTWDLNELFAWKRSYDFLNDFYMRRVKEDQKDPDLYTVDRPEIVKRHLRQVARDTEQSQFILDRIMDSQEYPSLETPELRLKVEQLKRKLLVNTGIIEKALENAPSGDEIEDLRNYIISITKTLNCSPSELLHSSLINKDFLSGIALAGTPIFPKALFS